MRPFLAPLNIAFYYTFIDVLIVFSIFKKLFSEENSKDLVLFQAILIKGVSEVL